MTGLLVTGRTQIDNNLISNIVEQGDFYAEWNTREGYWFFEETQENLDQLESDLEQCFVDYGINASFEAN